MDILAIQHSNTTANQFALFGDDRILYLHNAETAEQTPVASLDKIVKSPIKLYFHHPYICASECFGLHAAVVNLDTGKVLDFTREEYNSDVSSYSIAFFDRNGKSLLLHQTLWNRLDVTDLESGELLSKREVYKKVLKNGYKDESGHYVPRVTEQKNYLDFFHSLLHMSPNYKNFLSSGWYWSPVDNIRCFSVDEFLHSWEPGSFGIIHAHGYNWDRPCAFLDDDTFVIAADDCSTELDEEDLEDYMYHQFQSYRLSDKDRSERWLCPYKEMDSDVFPLDKIYGEVQGGLWFDSTLNHLIALSGKGAFALDLDGTVVWHMADIQYVPPGTREESPERNWQYSSEHHYFYRCDEKNRVHICSIINKSIHRYGLRR